MTSLNPILPIPVISIKSQLLPLGEPLQSEPLTPHPSPCPQLATVVPQEAPPDSTEIPKSPGLPAVRRTRTLNAPGSFLGSSCINPWLGKVLLGNPHSEPSKLWVSTPSPHKRHVHQLFIQTDNATFSPNSTPSLPHLTHCQGPGHILACLLPLKTILQLALDWLGPVY